ncbi:hypothetical protein KKJ01_04840 [Xenorhabdus bovienii]|uniref:Uncharacterized protein n=1 Tax=Xenorhabdus bovienii TaxID=40576 RepID=A0AAJ1J933_XENBV|nr:hypothetical protein [Xenorhabdus bovienii]MDE1477583.1 hypothetical protein [Xenorhabdus bovienii]MDE9509324.1 hypothetical protein [Xenorhabdus bovienii]MDE9520969.1 hypothetical protein [Xenorhabdus bovienii]
MSLETSIDKNNALLEQKNTLLEQQNALYTQNNSLIQQLLSALANNVVTHSAAPEKEITLKDEPYIQLAAEHVEQPNKKAKPAKKKAAVDKTPVDIETLDLETVVAIAVLFKNEAYDLTADKLAQARAVIEAVGEDRNGQVDALDSALQGLQELKPLTKATILDLCLEMVESWDDIPGITERREFALSLLTEGKQTPEPEPEPELDYAALYEQAHQALLHLAKTGYRSEAVGIVAKFGVKKLGDIPQDKLPEVIKLAADAWEE